MKHITQRMPLHILILGLILLPLGIWRCTVGDWKGIIWLAVSAFCLLTNEGIIIDKKAKIIRKYYSILFFKKVIKDKTIKAVKLKIYKSDHAQNLSVASITRTYKGTSYKLIAICEDEEMELAEGNKKKINKIANSIADELDIEVINEI